MLVVPFGLGLVYCHVYFSTGNQESQFQIVPNSDVFIYFRYFDIFPGIILTIMLA